MSGRSAPASSVSARRAKFKAAEPAVTKVTNKQRAAKAAKAAVAAETKEASDGDSVDSDDESEPLGEFVNAAAPASSSASVVDLTGTTLVDALNGAGANMTVLSPSASSVSSSSGSASGAPAGMYDYLQTKLYYGKDKKYHTVEAHAKLPKPKSATLGELMELKRSTGKGFSLCQKPTCAKIKEQLDLDFDTASQYEAASEAASKRAASVADGNSVGAAAPAATSLVPVAEDGDDDDSDSVRSSGEPVNKGASVAAEPIEDDSPDADAMVPVPLAVAAAVDAPLPVSALPVAAAAAADEPEQVAALPGAAAAAATPSTVEPTPVILPSTVSVASANVSIATRAILSTTKLYHAGGTGKYHLDPACHYLGGKVLSPLTPEALQTFLERKDKNDLLCDGPKCTGKKKELIRAYEASLITPDPPPSTGSSVASAAAAPTKTFVGRIGSAVGSFLGLGSRKAAPEAKSAEELVTISSTSSSPVVVNAPDYPEEDPMLSEEPLAAVPVAAAATMDAAAPAAPADAAAAIAFPPTATPAGPTPEEAKADAEAKTLARTVVYLRDGDWRYYHTNTCDSRPLGTWMTTTLEDAVHTQGRIPHACNPPPPSYNPTVYWSADSTNVYHRSPTAHVGGPFPLSVTLSEVRDHMTTMLACPDPACFPERAAFERKRADEFKEANNKSQRDAEERRRTANPAAATVWPPPAVPVTAAAAKLLAAAMVRSPPAVPAFPLFPPSGASEFVLNTDTRRYHTIHCKLYQERTRDTDWISGSDAMQWEGGPPSAVSPEVQLRTFTLGVFTPCTLCNHAWRLKKDGLPDRFAVQADGLPPEVYHRDDPRCKLLVGNANAISLSKLPAGLRPCRECDPNNLMPPSHLLPAMVRRAPSVVVPPLATAAARAPSVAAAMAVAPSLAATAVAPPLAASAAAAVPMTVSSHSSLYDPSVSAQPKISVATGHVNRNDDVYTDGSIVYHLYDDCPDFGPYGARVSLATAVASYKVQCKRCGLRMRDAEQSKSNAAASSSAAEAATPPATKLAEPARNRAASLVQERGASEMGESPALQERDDVAVVAKDPLEDQWTVVRDFFNKIIWDSKDKKTQAERDALLEDAIMRDDMGIIVSNLEPLMAVATGRTERPIDIERARKWARVLAELRTPLWSKRLARMVRAQLIKQWGFAIERDTGIVHLTGHELAACVARNKSIGARKDSIRDFDDLLYFCQMNDVSLGRNISAVRVIFNAMSVSPRPEIRAIYTDLKTNIQARRNVNDFDLSRVDKLIARSAHMEAHAVREEQLLRIADLERIEKELARITNEFV